VNGTQPLQEPYPLNLSYVGLVSFCRFPVCLDLAKLDADFAVLGIPFDEGVPQLPGQRLAPRRIRELSMKFSQRGGKTAGIFHCESGRLLLEQEFANNRLVDCGDVDIVYTKPTETFANITRAVRAILKVGAIPVIFGGDHSITFPVVQAFTDSPLDIVVIDAHLDFVDEIRGIRTASMNPIRRVSELRNVRHIIQVGLRGLRNSAKEWEEAKARGNMLVTAEELHRKGVGEVLAALPELGSTYLTTDIDGFDATVSPGCTGAEPGGLTYPETMELFRGIIKRGNVVGFDINEVNPQIDVGSDQTSVLAVHLALELMGEISESRRKLGLSGVRSRAGNRASKSQ
jgi:agmatinase